MKYERTIGTIITLLCALGAGTAASAQDRRLPAAVLGVTGGYDYGYGVPASDWNSDLVDSPYDNHVESMLVGLIFIFPKIFANGVGVSSTLSYGSYSLAAQRTGDRVIVHDSGPNETALTDHRYDFTSKAIQMDLMAYFQMGSVARFEVGPWGGIAFLPKYNETETILSPATAFFDNGSTVRDESGYDPAGALFLTGLAVRASLEIPMPGGWALLPMANARGAGVLTPDGNDGAIIGTIGAGLGVLFGQTEGEIVDPPPPPPAPPTSSIDTTPAPGLRARVDLYSQDGAGRRVDTLLLSSRRTLHRMEIPLMPVLYFDRNSAALPARYTGYSRSSREEFTIDGLVGLGAADVHRQALNVIGLRLASDPAASVVLWGGIAPGEPKWFATARAEAVRDYLAETWGVPSSQITIKGADAKGALPGKRGAQSVAITSTARAILEPIITEWIEQEVESSPIGLEPEIVAENGVKGWRATVLHGGREIGVLRNTDSIGTGILDAGVVLRDVTGGTIPALNAELIVEDSSGAVTVARDEMTVAMIGGGEEGADSGVDRRVNEYLVPSTSGDEMERAIARIIGSIGDSASIVLAPLLASGDDRPATERRLRAMADRLRIACGESGKSLMRLDIRDRASAPAEQGYGDDAGQIASLIQVTVVEQGRR